MTMTVDEASGSLGAGFGRLQGLSADLPRKNRWTIAEHAGDAAPDGMQHLLGRARRSLGAQSGHLTKIAKDVRGMTIPLQRLRDFELTTPGPGEISLAVARHEAEAWPSPEANAYAQHRAQLIHQLVDDTGVPVISWGETDSKSPREVVQVILELGPTLISSIGVVLAAWIIRPPKPRGEVELDRPKPPPDTNALLPGIAIKRHNGDKLMITYRDSLTNKEILGVVTIFLDGAVDKQPAGD
ncbi:MAG: hypothetical protein ACRDTH_13420 [Pseudonocardiaceae bacterium]